MDLPVRDDEDDGQLEAALAAIFPDHEPWPEPGEDPEHDAWLTAELEQALREADDPNTVWIDHEDVKRDTELRWAMYRRLAAEQAKAG